MGKTRGYPKGTEIEGGAGRVELVSGFTHRASLSVYQNGYPASGLRYAIHAWRDQIMVRAPTVEWPSVTQW